MAFNNYYLKLDSTTMNNPSPSKCIPTRYVIDIDSERNARTDLIRNIGGVKWKIEVEFPPMHETQFKATYSAFKKNSISVEFYDADSSSYLTATCYPTDLTQSPMFKKVGQEIVYDIFKVNLIEY